MPAFSPQLIAECQRVISKRAGFDISEEQAEACLDRLARLGEGALHIFKAEQKVGENYE